MKHLCNNINTACKKVPESAVYKVRDALPQSEFENQLSAVATVLPKVGQYLRELKPENWALYALVGMDISLYGHRTSNRVESENSRLLPARSDAPYNFLDSTAALQLSILSTNLENAKKYKDRGQALTGYAKKEYEAQDRLSQGCDVQIATVNIVYVTYTSAATQVRRTVDLDAKRCSCTRWQQYRLPCLHAIAAARAAGLLTNMRQWYARSVAPFYLAENYLAGYNACATLLPDKQLLRPDRTTKPADRVKQAGRPRKKRVRSAGDTSGTGTVIRRKHACSRCGGPHHRQTCDL